MGGHALRGSLRRSQVKTLAVLMAAAMQVQRASRPKHARCGQASDQAMLACSEVLMKPGISQFNIFLLPDYRMVKLKTTNRQGVRAPRY